jgi:hypothetical protein
VAILEDILLAEVVLDLPRLFKDSLEPDREVASEPRLDVMAEPALDPSLLFLPRNPLLASMLDLERITFDHV